MVDAICSKRSLKVAGHSLFDQKGRDIVCAAVSAVVMGGLNAVPQDRIKVSIDKNRGLIEAVLKKRADHRDEHVLEVIGFQLEAIAQLHPDHVRITTERQEP